MGSFIYTLYLLKIGHLSKIQTANKNKFSRAGTAEISLIWGPRRKIHQNNFNYVCCNT